MMEEVPTEPTDLLPDVVITEKNYLPVSTARQELTEGRMHMEYLDNIGKRAQAAKTGSAASQK